MGGAKRRFETSSQLEYSHIKLAELRYSPPPHNNNNNNNTTNNDNNTPPPQIIRTLSRTLPSGRSLIIHFVNTKYDVTTTTTTTTHNAHTNNTIATTTTYENNI